MVEFRAFQWGDITVKLVVDPLMIKGIRPEKFPAVRAWLVQVAKQLEENMSVAVPDEDGYFLGKSIAAKKAGKDGA